MFNNNNNKISISINGKERKLKKSEINRNFLFTHKKGH